MPAMLHAFKKNLARLQEPLAQTTPNGEFADYSQRLAAIKHALKYTSSMFRAANRTWVIHMQEQRQFSERFHESYPTTTDDVFAISGRFAEGSQALYDKFTRAGDEAVAYERLHKQVEVYVREIEELEATYPKLLAAKSETNRYQSKLDAMERSRRQVDATKKSRNLQKMDQQRAAYKSLLVATVDRQKLVYAKHSIVFKAALTAYWLAHEKHVNALVDSLRDTQQFARAHERELAELDVLTLKPAMTARSPYYAAGATSLHSISPSVTASSHTEFRQASTPPASTAPPVAAQTRSSAPPPPPYMQQGVSPVHTALVQEDSGSPTNVQDAPVVAATPQAKKPHSVTTSTIPAGSAPSKLGA